MKTLFMILMALGTFALASYSVFAAETESEQEYNWQVAKDVEKENANDDTKVTKRKIASKKTENTEEKQLLKSTEEQLDKIYDGKTE